VSQWERIGKRGKRRGETNLQFAAFQAYLLLGPERSIPAAIESKFGVAALPRKLSDWQGFSSKWKWVDRCAAYDAHVAALELAVYERRKKKLAERRADAEFKHQDVAEKLVELGLAKVTNLHGLPNASIIRFSPDGTENRISALSPSQLAAYERSLLEIAARAHLGIGASSAQIKRETQALARKFGLVRVRDKAPREKRDE
jgi:hypothetical protein